MARTLADRTSELLELLPPFERPDPTIQGLVDAGAREVDRLEASKAELIANFFPDTADAYLFLLEILVGRSPAPVELSLGQRRALVDSYMQLLKASPQGQVWEQRLQQIVSSVLTYVEQNDDQIREVFHDHFYENLALSDDWTFGSGSNSLVAASYGVREASATSDAVIVQPCPDFADRYVRTRAVAGSGNSDGYVAGVLKWIDASNYVGFGLDRTNLRIFKVVAGVYTSLANTAHAITTGRRYVQLGQIDGPVIDVALRYLDGSGNAAEVTLSHVLTGGAATQFGTDVIADIGMLWTNLYPDWTLEDWRGGQAGFAVANYHLQVGVPQDDPAQAAAILSVLRDITPAHLLIEAFSLDSPFVLGEDRLGLDDV